MNTVITIVAVYFVLVNFITFVIWGIDKWKADNHKWRIKEKTLLIWTAMGGFLGALIGMSLFHHKTIKGKFLRWFMLIAFGWLTITIISLYYIIY